MATRLKTVEYAFPMLTNVTHSTLTNFSQITLYLPESSKVFKSVELRVTIMDEITAVALTSWTARRVDYRLGSAAYESVNKTATFSTSSENMCIIVCNDITSHFSTNWSGTSMTFDSAILFTLASAYNFTNATCRLYITYEYDDTSSTQVKTVYIPLNAPVTSIDSSRPSSAIDTIPALDTYLPEATTVYRDMFIWFGCNDITSNTSDITVSHQIDSDTAYTSGVHGGAMSSGRWTEHIFKPTFTTADTHEYRVWCDVAARFNCPQIYLVVTYEYDESTSTRIMNSVQLPMKWESPAGTTAVPQSAHEIFWIQEPGTITTARVALYINFEQPVSLASNCHWRIGEGTWIQYASTAAVVCGQVGCMIRNDSAFALANGENVLLAGVYSASVNLTPTNISSLWVINYTSDKHSSGSGAHNHTVLKSIATHGTGSALLRNISSATDFMTIPETTFFVNTAGLIFEWMTNSTNNVTGSIIQIERLSSEGLAGWVSAHEGVNMKDPEVGIHINYAQIKSLFFRWDEDVDTSRLPLSTSRRYFTILPTTTANSISAFHERLTSVVTYHSIMFDITGNISGSNGGTVNIDLHRASDGQKVKVTSRTGNGSYSFKWHDNTEDVYCVAYEDSENLGRSANGKAS